MVTASTIHYSAPWVDPQFEKHREKGRGSEKLIEIHLVAPVGCIPLPPSPLRLCRLNVMYCTKESRIFSDYMAVMKVINDTQVGHTGQDGSHRMKNQKESLREGPQTLSTVTPLYTRSVSFSDGLSKFRKVGHLSLFLTRRPLNLPMHCSITVSKRSSLTHIST